MKNKILGSLAVVAAGASLFAAPEVIHDPYGVCAHVSRGEWQFAPQTFQKMHEAGINYVRTDFDWKYAEIKQGTWQYNQLDRVVELAKKENINVLPILDYDVPWATPAWKHLDLWSNYVRNLVTRYPLLRYWEVWNEQNSPSFWHDTSSGENYAKLLERTYREIKAINPELTVLYGGTAGVPLPFIEASLKAGAGKYFDVMNIHPYHWRGVPEMMFSDLTSLKALMRKYGVGEKPIWITEVGWATARPPRFFVDVLPSVLAEAGVDPAAGAVAVVNDPELGFFEAPNFNADFNLGMFRKVERIRLKDLKSLDVKRFPVLVPSTSEEFPMSYLPDVIDYVKRGGTLLLPTGLPFYHDYQMDGKGSGKNVQVNDKYLKHLHIAWETWWVKNSVPQQEKWQKPASRFAGKFKVDFKPTGRFLTDANLKKGDEFIPVIEASTDDYRGTICALYKLNSDLKGNIIVYSGLGVTDSTTEKRQAEMLPRTYLIALANGVERIFWYNFRAGEWKPDEREHHFGIVHADFSPKPAFHAYKTLTTLCPSGSTIPEISVHGKSYLANWKRPDGVKVWAVWTADFHQKLSMRIKGNAEAMNHLGEKQPVPGKEFTATPSILYLVGPESVTVYAR